MKKNKIENTATPATYLDFIRDKEKDLYTYGRYVANKCLFNKESKTAQKFIFEILLFNVCAVSVRFLYRSHRSEADKLYYKKNKDKKRSHDNNPCTAFVLYHCGIDLVYRRQVR